MKQIFSDKNWNFAPMAGTGMSDSRGALVETPTGAAHALQKGAMGIMKNSSWVNVQAPLQITRLGVQKCKETSYLWRIKFIMSCVQTTFRG